MEPAQESASRAKITSVKAAPPVEPARTNRLQAWLARTGTSFTAEYSIFLIMLGVSLSNVVWLVYIFFGLVVDTMNGGSLSSFVPAHMFALWLMISSVITVPLTYALWCRVQGEIAANAEYKGELPKGAAKGFRTFWLIVSVLGMAGLLMAALYAPLAAALSGGEGAAQMLLSVTLPSLVNLTVTGVGVYIVTRGMRSQKRVRVLIVGLALLTLGLFIADYIWASNSRHTTRYNTPSSDYNDMYNNTYNDPYYRYDLPSDYR